ncbi:HEAT repeat domain-containing protein [Affinibrenneria salicis]|uniref:HEAT repeat domain-containing protein n=1 Tax=Affinibrenneria salicis TaxID=2590031 RepID=A0A5J5FXU4_9GAMM|nr:HEAT repeat domain-containing protein [Affinibrenneria salicis]KAA8998926.1 HEAT repeat domain-containing protein [Affinibrenneria salicis]
MELDNYLYQQLEKRLADVKNFWRLPAGRPLNDTESLQSLTGHYNGHIRQIAVLCLGNRRAIAALPALIVRLNDWAEPVRQAARQSVRRLLRDEWAAQFVACLPEIYWLLECRRADHTAFVAEIIDLLIAPHNRPALLAGLASTDRRVARQTLRLLIERGLCSPETICLGTRRNNDPIVRITAAHYLMRQPEPINAPLLGALLRDRYVPLRQQSLQYIIDRRLRLPADLHEPLLLDKNTLVRQRTCRLLAEQGADPDAFYLNVLNRRERSAGQKSAALFGLNERRYPEIITLAQRYLGADAPYLYRSALQIVSQHQGDDASAVLLAALCHPSAAVAKTALRLFQRQGVRIDLDDLQRCLNQAPSATHIRGCYTLVHRLNKWDGLIFLLQNARAAAQSLTSDHISRWEARFNHSGIAPGAMQRQRLDVLIQNAPGAVRERNIARWLPAGR